jgi:hypothetical protein
MQWLDWQKAIIDEDDLEVFEVISVRNSGKTSLSLGWVTKDADISIIITDNAKMVRSKSKDAIKGLGLKPKELHIVSDLNQLKKLNTHSKRKVKIVVDEYFYQPDITLKGIDDVIGHEQYKVLFIGSRKSKDDKFKIPFSKQFSVDLVRLVSDKLISLDQLIDIIKNLDEEQLHIEFGAPFEN